MHLLDTRQRSSLWRLCRHLLPPSAEGAKGDFASAEATKGLCDRPLETFGPPLINNIRTKRWQVAAALSADVTTTKFIGDAPTLRRNQLCRNNPTERQLLFGRGGLGERRFS